MNWEDTVLTDEQMAKALDTSRDEYWDSSPLIGVVDYPERVIQAEATWRAVMQEKCFESYEMGVADGRRKGMREVAEWVEQNKLYALVPCPQELVIMWDNWQAKLMEWHVKEIT